MARAPVWFKRALAKSSARAGHSVTLSAKDPAHAEAKAKDTGARAARSAVEAVKEADVVILAVPYAALDAVLDEVGDALAGKVLIDVTNRMKRPAIAESVDGASAAEEIQRKAPKAKVAKAFNYAFASRQGDPKADGMTLDGFVAADDADAKAKTLAILNISLQMQHGWPWQSGWKLIGPTPEKKS